MDEFFFKTEARIIFDPIPKGGKAKNNFCVIATIRGDIVKYYVHLLEKAYGLNVRTSYMDSERRIESVYGSLQLMPPEYGAHVTLVKKDYSLRKNWKELKEKYSGRKVIIEYGISPRTVAAGERVHWWLRCKSADMENIREEMGLNPNPGYPFHITLGRPTPLTKVFSIKLWENFEKSNSKWK